MFLTIIVIQCSSINERHRNTQSWFRHALKVRETYLNVAFVCARLNHLASFQRASTLKEVCTGDFLRQFLTRTIFLCGLARRSLYTFSDYTGLASSGEPSAFILAFLFPSGFLFSVGLAHPFRPGLINYSAASSSTRYDPPVGGPEEKFPPSSRSLSFSFSLTHTHTYFVSFQSRFMALQLGQFLGFNGAASEDEWI